ncbi:MAG: glycosyl hydrolase family 39, partial [Gammaproteobacteria bacterium]|nr:glycosyl hydrolase family 39 [Gammaproteobacteria bacterium]
SLGGMSVAYAQDMRHIAQPSLPHSCVVLHARLSAPPSPVRVVIDGNAPAHAFPHFWEQMFGSGRASLSLRASYRHDMRAVGRMTDFRFVRFHGVLDRDVGVYTVDGQGRPDYNFTYVDQIYDGLLELGVRPFVELSFMPPDMASRQQSMGFWYDPIVAPPKDWALWSDLIRRFARHLVARYGIDEVSQWYFEVWNEPNGTFWGGDPREATYFQLYDLTARALKSVSTRLRVGGPATAQAAWVPAFIQYCATHDVPVDFLSTHVYGDDTAENVFGVRAKITRRDMVIRAVQKVHAEVKASPMPALPIIFSEFNATYTGNEVDVTDSPYIGPWLANTIRACDGLVDSMSYWTFSDVFEEGGVAKSPFHGGFGLIAAGGVPKASLNDFRLLHMLGDERLAESSDSALVTRRADGTLAIAVWNYAPPGPGGAWRTYQLEFHNVSGVHRAYVWLVDRDHGSALTAWKAMGEPRFPSFEQHRILLQAAELPGPRIETLAPGSPGLTLRLRPHALALVEPAN